MRFIRRHLLTAYAILVVAYLMLPIAVVILFSFNKPAGRFNYVWQEFTFANWVEWDSVPRPSLLRNSRRNTRPGKPSGAARRCRHPAP